MSVSRRKTLGTQEAPGAWPPCHLGESQTSLLPGPHLQRRKLRLRREGDPPKATLPRHTLWREANQGQDSGSWKNFLVPSYPPAPQPPGDQRRRRGAEAGGAGCRVSLLYTPTLSQGPGVTRAGVSSSSGPPSRVTLSPTVGCR